MLKDGDSATPPWPLTLYARYARPQHPPTINAGDHSDDPHRNRQLGASSLQPLPLPAGQTTREGTASENDNDISKFPETIAAHCPHLESLELWDYTNMVKDISSVLDSCQRLTRLSLTDIEFDDRAHRSLSRHYSHLTFLDLEQRCSTASAMIQQVMASCPRLNTLCASRLEARDILGVPMTDTSDTSESNGSQQDPNQAFRPQDWVFADTGLSQDGLDLRLKCGLDILSSLRLQKLGFEGLWQEMEEDDLRWMVAWPSLSDVSGRLHHRSERAQELECILKDKGIECEDEEE
ncbi:hypothetical protein B0O80DRAFT_500931 [Mortierella sp. GBAus27b]|nr:hypothetical protein B0O80DRAFT_500931 [Mortierella sp. GBAus27b]